MNALRQIAAVTAINVRSLPSRLGSSVVVVIGIAGVVGVLVSVMAMAGGLTGTLLQSGAPDRAIVMSAGANFEVASALSRADMQVIVDAPGVATTGGRAMASGELTVAADVRRRDDGSETGIMVRGLAPEGIALRDELSLVEGRLFEPGLRELIVGRNTQNEFANLGVGDQVTLRDGPWTVVGVFSTGGGVEESSLMADAETLQSAYRRNGFNSVRVRLESPEALQTFRDALTSDPRLNVEALSESTHYARQAENLGPMFFAITNVVGGIMALGAIFAALNTMYSAVSSRKTEIATLRAVGFNSSGVVASVLAESLVLALIGAAIGATIAWLLFNGNSISLGDDGGSLVGQMSVSGAVLLKGVAWACAIGILGGLMPALRAARLPVAMAVREL